MKTNKILRLIFAILICQLAGAIGSAFTFSSIPTWYASLQKPFFNPPSWLFGPAWLLLYTLMGISLYLIWDKGLKNKNVKLAVKIFGIQLILNALWTILFFGLRSPFYAFIEIILLWVSIVLTIFYFLKISKKAACLLVPYLLWVTFALALNYSILVLN